MKNQAALCFGRTWHRRLRPVDRSFSYRVLFVWLPMRQWQRDPVLNAPNRNRWGLLSFYDKDHGLGGSDALAWIEKLIQDQGLVADGEIWLQTLPRILGFAFKPVSFWHIERLDGSLEAVLAEVNNTFGERHCYLLRFDQSTAQKSTGESYRLVANSKKVLHVSPFCDTKGCYGFEFRSLGKWRSARIELADEQGALLKTSLSGYLEPFCKQRVLKYVIQMPLAALAVIWRIHWQALQLFWLRMPFFRQPPAPTHFVSE